MLDVEKRLIISDRAHIVLDIYKVEDAVKESGLGDAKIGTTNQGIGPGYSHKATRDGLRMADYVGKWDTFVDKYTKLVAKIQTQYPGVKAIQKYDTVAELAFLRVRDERVVCMVERCKFRFLAQPRSRRVHGQGDAPHHVRGAGGG
jgi:adenylosuccinate synthase